MHTGDPESLPGDCVAKYLERLRKAFFLEGADISRRITLLEIAEDSAIDPLAFFVGPVWREVASGSAPDPAAPLLRDLTPFLDREAKTVASVTGELLWDWGGGLATIDAPRVQGACGFLGAAGAIELGAVTIECASEYASLLVVSLDGEPIPASRRLLVQAVTEERPYGWRTEGDRITSVGAPPLLVRELDAALTLRTDHPLARVRFLDPHGYETHAEPLDSTTGTARIPLAPDRMYAIVE